MTGQDKILKTRLIVRIWNSPTFNTWLSYSTRALSLFIVLPLILKYFTNAEVALWYLFASIIALQGLADLGFRNTFIRLIAYGKGGAIDINGNTLEDGINRLPFENWDLIAKIYSTMTLVYRWLSLFYFILLASLGSWALIKPIENIESKESGWIAWIIILLVSIIKLYGDIFSNYLEGLNKIALVRRIEALTSICATLSNILVLYFYKSILLLVISSQIWVIINVFRNYYLCRYVENGIFKGFTKPETFDKDMFKKIWDPAWKSGLSGFMSNGLNHISSILYAQIGNSAMVASYLLALRLINQVKEISMAPFYSKIPHFASLRVSRRIDELTIRAQKGMFFSHLVFIFCVIILGLIGPYLLSYIGSDVKWLQMDLWCLISIAFFIHRFGAMHMQLYMTTNHIIAHIADGVSGVIFIIVAASLIKNFELYAIPIGMLAGYLGFYSWFSASASYKSLSTSFIAFERKAGIIPLLIFVIYVIVSFIN